MRAPKHPSRRPLTILSALCAIALGASVSSIACSSGDSSTQPDAVSTSSRVAGTASHTNGAPDEVSDPAAGEAPDLTEGKDILAEVLKYNSDAYDSPPDHFRTGHVTPRELPRSAINQRRDGFTVQLPNGAPITTPAVHAGIVVSSGGFHSKEIYAFKAESGDLAWAINLDDDGPSAPACEDRVCVFNTESCTVFALDARTGEMLWSWWLGDPLTSAPTIAGGLAFASYPAQGNSNILQQAPNATFNGPAQSQQWAAPQQAAKPANGAKKTKRDGDDKAKGRPPGQSHALAAFDLHTGEIKWTRWIDSDVMSAPVAIGNALYATTFAGTVYKFDQKTGDILAARKTRATSAPVIHGDDIWYTKRTDAGDGSAVAAEGIARSNAKQQSKSYVVASKRAEYLDRNVQRQSKMAAKGKSLDASNGFGGGAPESANAGAAKDNVGQASVSTMQAFQGSRILHAHGDNISSMGDEVICTDADTGKERWKVTLKGDMAGAGGFLATAPAAAGGSIFIGTLAGKVLQLDPKTGKTKRTFEVGAPIRSQPIIDGGWIYVGTDDGKLVGIDTGDESLVGWTQWGGNAARTGVVR